MCSVRLTFLKNVTFVQNFQSPTDLSKSHGDEPIKVNNRFLREVALSSDVSNLKDKGRDALTGETGGGGGGGT